MAEFIKLGKHIIAKPKGADYELVGGATYHLSYDRYNDQHIFTENGNLNMPKKIYEIGPDKIFKKRVLSYFEQATTQTTGVLLTGTKGTGKTVLAKVLALDSGLPIIIVDPDYPARKLNDFFNKFTTPVAILFDEIEKNWDTTKMLEFLDGVQETAKKLVLMTCNDVTKVSEFMRDRCSRIRYRRKYGPRDNAEIVELVAKDMGIKNYKVVADFVKSTFKLLSMDNVCSFLTEVKLLEEDNVTLSEIVKFMNIELMQEPEEESTSVYEMDDMLKMSEKEEDWGLEEAA